MRLLYAEMAHVKHELSAVFLERGVKNCEMAKSKKNKTKPKLNLTVREEQRNKLEQMASLENRSLSNLIEVMADERWKRLAEQQGVACAKTAALRD
jgi:hypothetical protein